MGGDGKGAARSTAAQLISVEETIAFNVRVVVVRALATMRELFGLGDGSEVRVKMFSSPNRGITPAGPEYECADSVTAKAALERADISLWCHYWPAILPREPNEPRIVCGHIAGSMALSQPFSEQCVTAERGQWLLRNVSRMSSSLLPSEQSLPAAFGHPLVVVDLESRFLTGCGRDTRAGFRADLDPWFAFCSEFTINALSAQERHVAGYVRHQTEVEWADTVTVERRLATLSIFYDYAVACSAATINPVTVAVLAMVEA